jgi:hypothetical protein
MNQEDRSRLEEFRQFRKEVRGSKEYLLVGIDVPITQILKIRHGLNISSTYRSFLLMRP